MPDEEEVGARISRLCIEIDHDGFGLSQPNSAIQFIVIQQPGTAVHGANSERYR
jgi:hypothetical protein